jgi:hypothetical protein
MPTDQPRGPDFLSAQFQQMTWAGGIGNKGFVPKKQQQNKREQEVQLDGSAGFKQHSSNMPAGMGHVWGFATAPFGEVVRRCLGPAIF